MCARCFERHSSAINCLVLQCSWSAGESKRKGTPPTGQMGRADCLHAKLDLPRNSPVFAADSCHSGFHHRNIRLRASRNGRNPLSAAPCITLSNFPRAAIFLLQSCVISCCKHWDSFSFLENTQGSCDTETSFLSQQKKLDQTLPSHLLSFRRKTSFCMKGKD